MEECRKQPSKYICRFWCGTYLDKSPPDCTRHVNYDRNAELPGYLAERGGAKVCIPFLATDQLSDSGAEDKPSTSGVPAFQFVNEAGSAHPGTNPPPARFVTNHPL